MVENHLTSVSPLMQPVTHNGHQYFTSQYFHQQYLANSPHGGKFRRHAAFLKAIRSIPAYALHADQRDIVEIPYRQADSLNPAWIQLFRSTGYQPVTILNATAQAALSHHLDDEVSKQMSVAINARAARQASTATFIPTAQAKAIMGDVLDIAKMLGTPEYIARQEAVKLVAKETGVDLRPLLRGAPSQDNIPDESVMLEPTDLAKELGLSSGKELNQRLYAIGWQVKTISGQWEPTATGKPYAAKHAWTSDHSTKSGTNYKWNVAAVKQALGA